MKRRTFAAALLGLALAAPGTASALAAIEFMRLDDATKRREALEPIIHGFLSRGFKKVPDWPALGSEVRRVILERGYTYQALDSVAEEAAVRLGMYR